MSTKMKIEVPDNYTGDHYRIIDFDEQASIFTAMTVEKTENTPTMVTHTGDHPDYGHTTLIQMSGSEWIVMICDMVRFIEDGSEAPPDVEFIEDIAA